MVMICILFSPHRLQLADAVPSNRKRGRTPFLSAGKGVRPHFLPRQKAAQYSGPENQFKPLS
jgi:hypothetical protein